MELAQDEYIAYLGIYYNINQGITSLEFSTSEGNFRVRGNKVANDYYRTFKFSQLRPLIGFSGTSSYVPSSIGPIIYDTQCDTSEENQAQAVDAKSKSGQSFNELSTETPEDERKEAAGVNLGLLILVFLILAILIVTAIGVFCCYKIRKSKNAAAVTHMEDDKEAQGAKVTTQND